MARATKIAAQLGGDPPVAVAVEDDGGGKTEYLLTGPATTTDADAELLGGELSLVAGPDGAPRLRQNAAGLPREMILKRVSLGAASGVGAASNWAPNAGPPVWFRYEAR